MDSARSVLDIVWAILNSLAAQPFWVQVGAVIAVSFNILILPFIVLVAIAPSPRPPRPSEKQYVTVTENGKVSSPLPLPCWYDKFVALSTMAKQKGSPPEAAYRITDPECFMSLVVPAYNETERITGMLEEAVEYLEEQYGQRQASGNGSIANPDTASQGWEIILVSDGSTDGTIDTVLKFARTHVLNKPAPTPKGPWSKQNTPTNIPAGTIRIVELEENRGKGGAVTHGMRHARGVYVVFADADGASRFTDLGKLVSGCEKAKDQSGRAVAVGSRAHMVATEAVVKRSVLRNTLMRGFHLLIWMLTTPRTAKIKDTQCGFKLFTRQALPYIIPYMHSEGWIFDVEMLMLAESANIPMVEVPIGWKEVKGSKLNVIKDSIGMAIGLALLRVCWGIGIFSRD